MGSGEHAVMTEAALAGFALGGGLIVAIGAQNAFVIRQGILNQHVFWICLFCSIADATLIWSGVYGLGVIVEKLPIFVTVMTYGGAAFLIWYGVKAVQRVLSPIAMKSDGEAAPSLLSALTACAGFTLLNPHVYLDTVVLVGSIANARPVGQQFDFALGASVASFLWFFTIGFGARALGPVLNRPTVWRVLDVVIAAIMFLLAARLLLG
jgi:L-lysine exporter family protein LysE/ArgO